jgi:spoIIIJ-associated protein
VLVNAIAGGAGDERREVGVDASGYRDRRRRTLEALAHRSAEEAVRTGSRVELEPMSAAERKIVHTSLEHHEGVTTVSEGEGSNRRVVVEPVN